MKPTKLWVLIAFLTVLSFPLSAQDDLGKQLSKVAGANAVSYVSPLLSAWGADLNSGFYHSADLHEILGFDVGLKAGTVLVKDADKTFDFVMPDHVVLNYLGVTYPLTAGTDYDKVIPGTPTALGDKAGIPVKVKSTFPIPQLRGQTIFTTPQGFNLKYVPLFMPQAAVGLPFGLEVVGRFVPTLTLPNDVGKVNFIGFGVRYSLDQHIPLIPFDLAVHFMTQKLTVSDMSDTKILGASGTAYGVEISKSLALFTVYGGYQIEKSKWDIESYSYSDPSTATSFTIPGFSVEGKNTSRLHVGVRLLLLIVSIHADYSLATQPVLTAGIGISFR